MTFHFFSKKKVSKYVPIFRRRKSSGFALMVALGLMSFVLIIVLGLSTLVQVNSNITSAEKNLDKAKRNALFALNLAIGDLQNEMGPDQRISATASILDGFPETEEIDGVNNPYWTGTWNSDDPLKGNTVNQVVSKNRTSSDGKPSHFRRWLISTPINAPTMAPEESIEFVKNFSKKSEGAILMVGSGTVGEEATAENSVYVPRQIINKELEEENGYAYWVGDEGVKSRVAGAKPKNIQTDLEQILNVNNAGSPRLNAIDGFADAVDISAQSDKILTLGTAQFAFNEALGGNIDAFKNKFHSLSAFSRGLMVDVKHGGTRKDLSLLFASGSLPLEYEDQPMFIYESSLGPSWNYALRYHNIYKLIKNNGGRNYINTSDFWDDAKTDIGPSEIKYADIPIPVLARMQVIFSLHKQRNTFNGRFNPELESEDEADATITDLFLPEDWETSGSAEINQSWLGSVGAEFKTFDTSPDTYFTIADIDALPLTFNEGGRVYIERLDIYYYHTLNGYIKFSSSDSGTEIIEPFSLISSDSTLIEIPPIPNVDFDHFSLHFDADSANLTSTLIGLTIESDYKPGPAKFQSNDEEILHLMMTPIMYLWNPYNVEIVMDSDDEKKLNRGAYQYFYAPPDVEFTFDNRNWISLKSFKTFQFGDGAELFVMWSSNNKLNRITQGSGFKIPAGEFRYNMVIPPPYTASYNRDTDPYIRMQFFNPKESGTKYLDIFGNNDPEVQGFPDIWMPHVANWVESTNDSESFNRVFTGVFSPVLNYQEGTGAGLNTNGSPGETSSRLKKVVSQDTPLLNFRLRLKNQFFASRLSLGGGWSSPNPDYDPQGNIPIFPSRLVGALNIDTNNEPNSFDSRSYHFSESANIPVGYFDLPPILGINNEFVGLEPSGGYPNAKKIALNVDIRGFSEGDTPGKHAFFIDPANNYYYDDVSDDTSLSISPFRIYIREMDRNNIIIPNPESDSDSIIFETIANDQITKCVAKELPLIPLLSLAQLDHAPLGRDYEHFAYFSGRHIPDDFKNHFESDSLLGRNNKVLFPGKEPRRMAPSFNMAVGNSWAHPTIPLNEIIEVDDAYEGYATDRSYLLNETLFDSYFFTGLAFPSGPFVDDMEEMSQQLSEWINDSRTLPNSNYKFKVPQSMSKSEVIDTFSYNNVDTTDLFDKIANFIEIEGAFNINSTSVDSWVAQLTSLRGKSVLYDNSDYGAYNIDTTNTENTPVLSQTIPAEKSLENTGGTQESIFQNSWSHYRSLEDAQLLKLAEEIVKQIKARGPFLSLSQFFNREISERKPYNIKGAIQTAIDESLINLESVQENVTTALKERFERDEGNEEWLNNTDFASPEIFENGANEGLPGYITQASLMRPLCPILSARSDTFIIRAYGDFKENGITKASTWCEAVVQRRIDLIDDENILKASYDENDAETFNRKFEIVSFRWLNADEI
jgi:hypothetical protein